MKRWNYDDLIERLRNATALPMIQSLCNEAADAIDALAADRRCAVPVSPHGRLIDADALLNDKGVRTQIAGWGKMYHETVIEFAPTIIEAEEGEEQREYEAQVEAAQYCEMYEPTYDPETGAL